MAPRDLQSNRVQIIVPPKRLDFCKGHGRLAILAETHTAKEPFTGTVLVFRSQRRPVEPALSGWHRAGHGLQVFGGHSLHLTCGPGRSQDAEPCAASGADVRSHPAKTAGRVDASTDCGRMNQRILLDGTLRPILSLRRRECGDNARPTGACL